VFVFTLSLVSRQSKKDLLMYHRGYQFTVILCHLSIIRALSVVMTSKCVKAHSCAEILMVLSPAKSLDLSPGSLRFSGDWTLPNCNDAKTRQIAAALKKRTVKDLEVLLGISSKLAKTAHEVSSNIRGKETLVYRRPSYSNTHIV
jgi:hypothetical protein